MFGYVKPFQPNLRIRDFEAYKGLYCALCRTLGKRYGVAARMTLSYDGTFLAVLSVSLRDACPGFQKGRCGLNPLKKCNYALNAEESLQPAAAATVLLTYYSLQDDIRDGSFWKRTRARFLSQLGRRAFKKAAKDEPELQRVIAEQMERQAKVEEHPEEGSLDAAADPSGKMLSAILFRLGRDDLERRILEEIGYYLGRWVYLIDAADDMAKDAVKKNYNPFLLYYDCPDNPEKIPDKKQKIRANEVLNSCVARLLSAFNLLEIKQLKPLVENILTEGLADTQRIVLFTEEKKHVRSI